MAEINLKNKKRILRPDESPYKQVMAGTEKPRFRQNGYQLDLLSVNNDNLSLSKGVIIGDSINMSFILGSESVDQYFFSDAPRTCRIVITSSTFEVGVTNVVYKANGVVIPRANGMWVGRLGETITMTCESLINTTVTKVCNQPNGTTGLNCSLLEFEIAGEKFDLSESYGNTLTGSDSTSCTVNTSHVDGLTYINSTMWQKKSFALVGNGTTEKIVFPNLSEIILTSTPLVGGFIHEGKTYNLTEGLGNKILSEDETTEASIISDTTDLNYGMWQKGDDTNGWNSYTV